MIDTESTVVRLGLAAVAILVVASLSFTVVY
jgi:hypothetical protein